MSANDKETTPKLSSIHSNLFSMNSTIVPFYFLAKHAHTRIYRGNQKIIKTKTNTKQLGWCVNWISIFLLTWNNYDEHINLNTNNGSRLNYHLISRIDDTFNILHNILESLNIGIKFGTLLQINAFWHLNIFFAFVNECCYVRIVDRIVELVEILFV